MMWFILCAGLLGHVMGWAAIHLTEELRGPLSYSAKIALWVLVLGHVMLLTWISLAVEWGLM